MDIKPIEFRIDDESMSFTPLPLGTLDIIERLKVDLHLDKNLMQSFPIAALLIAAKHQREIIAKIVALYTLGGEVSPSSVRQRSDFFLEHCKDEDLVLLLISGMVANEMWIRNVCNVPTDTGINIISYDDILNKPFCQLLKQFNR